MTNKTAVGLLMPDTELEALAQLVKRIDYATCQKLANKNQTYDNRTEADVMWSAVCMLQHQLADAGFNPR